MRKSHRKPVRSALSVVILSILHHAAVEANPNGAQVVNGQVSINTQIPGVMNITNSPNAIINWQSFGVAQHEITRFIQQNGQSAVLNRVIGQDPSQIMGQLISNGRVFLINPNGIVFGANSIIDTQGLIASSLNLSDTDFLSGNYHFVAGSSAGNLLNEGIIRAGKDGNIVLIAPNIENSGIIQTDGGKITLAAGQELTLTSLDEPDIQYQVKAPENEVLNLGKVLTNGGAIDLFAGTITHSGELNANSIEIDEQGNIRLIAEQDITLTEDSLITADNSQGDTGSVLIDSEQGTTLVSGDISAQATHSGKGGEIHILGEQVGLTGKANINASGVNGGGEVLVGGGYQGNNTEIHNAKAVFISPETEINADAMTSGKGGKVIVWAEETASIHGEISATGGAQSGDGGFVETSAKQNLKITQAPDVTAAQGKAGQWLIDPNNIDIVAGNGLTNIDSNNLFQSDNDGAQLGVVLVEQALSGGATVIVKTSAGGSEEGNINFNTTLELDNTAGTNTLQLSAHNDINFNADINDSSIGGETLNLQLIADSDNSSVGKINIASNLNTGGGSIDASNGSGVINFTNNSMIDSELLAKDINISTGTVTLNGLNNYTDNLSVTGGALRGSGSLNVTNSFLWDRGTLGGSGGLNTLTGSTSTLSSKGFPIYLSEDRIWNNNGTVVLDSALNEFGLTVNAQFNNQSSGIVEDNTVGVMFGIFSRQASINNVGIWNKTGRGRTIFQNTHFNNLGTVNVNNGIFELNTDGIDTGAYYTGDVATGRGTIEFRGRSRSINGGSLAGGGNLNFTGANVSLRAGTTYKMSSPLKISGGSLSFGTGGEISLADIDLQGGILSIASSDKVRVSNSFNWRGGDIIGSGLLNTLHGSNSEISGNITLAGNWQNSGVVNWVGGNRFVLQSNGFFRNSSDGVFNDYTTGINSNIASWNSRKYISNRGVWNKLGTTGDTSIEVKFNNRGLVNVNSGDLELNSTGINSGGFNIANGSLLKLNGPATYNSPANFVGEGTVEFFNTTLFSSTLDVVNDASNNFVIDDGPLQIASFTQPANGRITDNGDGSVTYTSDSGFSGIDPFTMVVKDSFGNIASSARLNLNVANSPTPTPTPTPTPAPAPAPAPADIAAETLTPGPEDTREAMDRQQDLVLVLANQSTDAPDTFSDASYTPSPTTVALLENQDFDPSTGFAPSAAGSSSSNDGRLVTEGAVVTNSESEQVALTFTLGQCK